ncbi:AMP-binding protein [Alteromonadaceae bacterium BrNp21-10]|nr:AMP-binding protein [Alteromonadaceae bacterium BrNp21-10]
MSSKFRANDATEWLLYEPDFQQFSIYFIALLYAQKNILLAANGQPEKLKELHNEFEIAIVPNAILGINCWNQAIASSASKTIEPHTIDPQQTIHFLTSGSSGAPKKITKHWRQLTSEVDCQQLLWTEQFNNTLIAASVSHQHIYGLLFKFLLPLLTGKPIYAPMIQFPEHLLRLTDYDLNIALISSPAYLTRTAFTDDIQNAMQRLQCIFSSGGVLPTDVAKQLYIANGISPIELYGSTETGGIAWRQSANSAQWTPLPGIQINNTDDQRLSIRSPFLANKNWFMTDDLIEINDAGRFELKGRVDRIVKLEEKRLSLNELESILSRFPQCKQAVATILNNKRMQLVVVIEWTEIHNSTTTNKQRIALVRDYLRGFYETVLLPRKWRFVDTIPINEQGKTTQAMLIKLFG